MAFKHACVTMRVLKSLPKEDSDVLNHFRRPISLWLIFMIANTTGTLKWLQSIKEIKLDVKPLSYQGLLCQLTTHVFHLILMLIPTFNYSGWIGIRCWIFFFSLLFPPLLKALAQAQEAPCGDVLGFALASLHYLGKHSFAYSLLLLRAELG